MLTRWIVEMTIDGSVRPVEVQADGSEAAKDAAEAKHPEATRIYGAHTLRQWSRVLRAVLEAEGL
jgi:hypothetical protein